jgi:hypothetical protein
VERKVIVADDEPKSAANRRAAVSQIGRRFREQHGNILFVETRRHVADFRHFTID